MSIRETIIDFVGKDSDLLLMLNAETIEKSSPKYEAIRETMTLLGQIDSGWSPEVFLKMKMMGVETVSPAFQDLGRDITQSDVDDIRADHALDLLIGQVHQDFATGMNENVNPALAIGDRAAVVAGLRATADAMEAG